MIQKPLPITDPPQRKTARVRQHYDAIEASLAAGLSHSQVHNWLRQQGIDIEFRHYHNILHRIRSGMKKNGGKVEQVTAARAALRNGVATGGSTSGYGKPTASDTAGEMHYDVTKEPRKW